MKPENVDALKEPPPFRQSLFLLLSFWLLPFWCFSHALSGILALSSFYDLPCLLVYVVFLFSIVTLIRRSSVFEYHFSSYYWITWVIAIVFASELDSLYYALSDWQVALLPHDQITPMIIYGVVYYLLPASSLLFLGHISWEYYASESCHRSVDWASILVDNTPFAAALMTWDASLSDGDWIVMSICGYVYYLIPRGYCSKVALKFSSAKHSSGVARTTRKPLRSLTRFCNPVKR